MRYITRLGPAFISFAALLLSGCAPANRFTEPMPDSYTTTSAQIGITGRTSTIQLAEVTPAFFKTARAAPLLGRDFIDGDYNGQAGVAVLSERIWRQSFGADPSVIGKPITLNGRNLTVVGIMPQTFDFPRSVDVWIPHIPSNDR